MAAARKLLQNITVSISHTTRPQRTGEQDGSDYHFVDNNQFNQLIEQEAFIEYANVFGYYYGTSKAVVSQALESGRDVVLEIDCQGASQVHKHIPQAITVFISPVDFSSLKSRLEGRGTDSAEVITKRLREARVEMEQGAGV